MTQGGRPGMTPERWREVEAVLDAALDLPAPERATYVAAACTGDHELRTQVEKLLAAVDAPAALVPDEPAAQFAAPVLARITTEGGGLGPPPRPSQAMRTPMPERIGPYRVIADAGEGGMGVVYIAERDDGTYAKRVALKVVRRGLHLDARFNRRFQEERQILARLDHTNIARLLDGGVTDDGLPYFVMEYVEGEPIDRWCDARRLSIEERLRLFVKVCGAVAYLHKHGVVHRDLKPSNILVTDEGEPKLLDFGIAKMLVGNEHAPTTVLTQTGQRLLTPDYASPEQVRGASITEASDVYALGVLLYELLTARRPYRRRGRTLHQIERVILEDEPTRPSLAVTQPVVLDGGITDGPSRAAALRATTPPRLRQLLRGDIDAIILTALRKEPERRYHSADEFAADVCRHLDGLAVVARGDGVGYRVRKLLRRHRTLIAAGTIGVAAGIFFIVFLLAQTGMGSQEQGGFGAAPRVQPGATRRVAFTPALELDPELSPDGRMVAYVAPDSNDMMRIFVRSVDGGQSRMITAALDGYHRAPRWSPDGRRIAFQAKRQLWVVPADGSAPPTSFVKAEPYALSIAWSPDGREIAWSQGQSIYVRAVDGGEPRKLDATANWPHSLRWSPDGRWIAYVDDNYAFLYGAEAGGGPISLGNTAPSSIWLVPARPGGTHVRITHDRALNTTPAWLPESRGLLFVSNRDGDRDVYQLALGRDGRPAGAPVRVTAGLGVHSISVTPDGRRLAYAVFRNSANIWSVPILEDRVATEADLQPVTTGMQSIEGMSVSRDGQWLTFDSDRDGRQQIYKLPLTGGEPIRLTNAPTDDFIPAWSPDGKEIAYYSIDTTGRRIHVMSADGSVHRQIGPWPPGQRSPSWSPDGKRITFNASHLGASELFVATRLRDGWDRPVQITERNKGGGMARWSPTGNSIVYLREDGVWTASPDGGVPRLVVPIDPARRASLGAAEWSSDGRTIYYRWFDERWRTTIRAVPERGGPSREIMRLESPARQSRRGEMSCGAGRCYFTIAEHMGDVWTMELAGR